MGIARGMVGFSMFSVDIASSRVLSCTALETDSTGE